ncbi:glyoxalase [Shewanella hanedai]|nr:glyoxalase [Shewanella hanedai]
MSWLCDVIGFDIFLEVSGNDNKIEHARLTLGSSMVMLASLGRDGLFESKFKTPQTVKCNTQCTFHFVEDPSVIYNRALAAGANIIQEIESFEFGGETFIFEDIESHIWVITSHDPWKVTW